MIPAAARPGRRAFLLSALALLWSVGLLVAAVAVPTGGSTFVQDQGTGVLWALALPAILSLMVGIALWRKCSSGSRVGGYVAWVGVWLLCGFCVLAILSIGIFVLPVVLLLAFSASLTPSGARTEH